MDKRKSTSYGYVCQPTGFVQKHLFYALGMGYITNDRNFLIDRQSFPGYLFVSCISGKLHIIQYGVSATLEPGQCCLMTLMDAHKYYSDSEDPCKLLWLHFDGKDAAEMLRLIFEDTKKYSIIADPLILPVLQHCISSYEADSMGSCFPISSNIYRLLLLFLEETVRGSAKENRFLSPLTKELDTFLSNHIGEKITLERMAEQCHLNPSYFCRRFHEETNMTPMQYLMQKRIALAKYYLTYSHNKMAAIARELGFYDQNHFSCCFSKAVGISPSEFRVKSQKTVSASFQKERP